jgi:uncharacterized membrane protein
LGFGGFIDGIILHQLLQWHHLLSSWYPITNMESLEFNTWWDGVFHSVTYAFLVIGAFLLWRAAQRGEVLWSTRQLIGSMLIGFGLFNAVEGTMSHHLLGIHHVNETIPREHWFVWDVGFTTSGLLMLLVGYRLYWGRRAAPHAV